MSMKSGSRLKKLAMHVMSLSLICSSALLLPVPVVKAYTQAIYYVDPVNGQDTNDGSSTATAFRTIEHARDTVRTINANMTGDIEVKLRGGTYTLNSTLNFTDIDSGTNGNNIIYSAYNGEKPVFSGGKSITGWSMFDSSKNIYRAYAGGNIETRQLFVNGQRAQRARSIGGTSTLTFTHVSATNSSGQVYEAGTGYTATGSIYADSTIPMHSWGNLSDVEFVYNVVFTSPRAEVGSITNDGTTTTVTMKMPGWDYVTNRGGTSLGKSGSANPTGAVWFVENAYELLDTEGEWYLDRSTDYIYYKPKANEDITTSEVIAPVLEDLVHIQGADLDHKASNMQFKGITFAYSTWLRPNTYGQTDAQNNVIREAGIGAYAGAGEQLIGAAVNLKYANSVTFERDVFEHLGGAGLNMYAGSQDNLVQGSRFMDISGNAIQVGDYIDYGGATSENYAGTTDARLILRNNDLYNNYIANIGVEYFSSSAISATFPQDMNITHNEIANVPYSGIHIGWGWGVYPSGSTPSVIKNVYAERNYIHEVNVVLNDGGGIYTNGKTGGNATLKAGYFNENYIANVYKSAGYAMYNDEATNFDTYYEWNNNVINGAAKYAFQWRNGKNAYNNTYTNVSAYSVGGTNTVTNTTIVSGTNWPTAAQTIINNAGLESAYQDIKPPVIPPEQILNENFNSMNSGSAPTGWTVDNAGGDGSVTVQDVPSPSDKSMKLVKTSIAANTYLSAGHGFAPLYSGTVEVRAKAEQTNAIIWPIALYSGSTLPIEVRFGNNGQIAYRNSSGVFVDLQAYTAGTWYDFKVVFDTVTDTYDLYINSVKKLTNAAFAVTSGPIDSLQNLIYRQSTGTGYMDNVKVTEGDLRYNENFNAMTTASAPAGWTLDNAGGDGTITVQDIPSSTDKSMQLTKTSTASNRYLIASRKFTPATTGTVEVKAKVTQTNAVVEPIVLSGSGSSIEIGFFNNGQITYKNTSAAWVNIQAYTAGTWYDFKLEFDTTTDKYALYINGALKISNIPFGAAGGPIDTLSHYIFRGSTGTTNIDNVKISEGIIVPVTPVSLNKTVTGYSSQYNATDWKATNINDGVVTTTNRGWASATGSGTRNEWVTIDLGQSYSLTSFTLQNEDVGDNRNVKDYILYGSTTGAFAGEEFVISSGTIPSLLHLDTYSVIFTPASARYIKFKGTSSYSSYVIVGELSLYGN